MPTKIKSNILMKVMFIIFNLVDDLKKIKIQYINKIIAYNLLFSLINSFLKKTGSLQLNYLFFKKKQSPPSSSGRRTVTRSAHLPLVKFG